MTIFSFFTHSNDLRFFHVNYFFKIELSPWFLFSAPEFWFEWAPLQACLCSDPNFVKKYSSYSIPDSCSPFPQNHFLFDLSRYKKMPLVCASQLVIFNYIFQIFEIRWTTFENVGIRVWKIWSATGSFTPIKVRLITFLEQFYYLKI